MEELQSWPADAKQKFLEPVLKIPRGPTSTEPGARPPPTPPAQFLLGRISWVTHRLWIPGFTTNCFSWCQPCVGSAVHESVPILVICPFDHAKERGKIEEKCATPNHSHLWVLPRMVGPPRRGARN